MKAFTFSVLLVVTSVWVLGEKICSLACCLFGLWGSRSQPVKEFDGSICGTNICATVIYLWCKYIVGTTGDHIAVPNAQGLHETLDELESNAELATILRLWVLQIPLLGVPPLVVAIMPIGSKVKGPQLADWQIGLLKGLVSHGFRITSSGGDGASVERDCQRRTAAAGKLVEVSIKHPDPDYADIIVQLSDLDGNIWAVIQDAKHGRKTFRNNIFSGAHILTLGILLSSLNTYTSSE
ncbi:hypothetical protein B0H13DRAFT_1895153 [Mycena leptocephala]|nr:hypothetical protein B0H13DRAFT_1895153 [Mycena leptocephala]